MGRTYRGLKKKDKQSLKKHNRIRKAGHWFEEDQRNKDKQNKKEETNYENRY